MVKLPSLLEMLQAGAHFGHQKSRWHPKMKDFIYTVRNGVHIINLERTVEELEKALTYVKSLTAEGKIILFVGTKHQAREAIKSAAIKCGMPYITERWLGGLLTNFEEVRKRLKKYLSLKDQFATGEIERYIKKEQVVLKKSMDKMERYLLGIVSLDKRPDFLYIADMRTEKTALAETERTNTPVVAVCDSNTNPTLVTRAIPANDDAINSISLFANLIADAVLEGKQEWEKKRAAAVQEEAAKKVKPEPVKKERKAVKIVEA